VIFEPHTLCWFGPGNVTAAGWKLGGVKDQHEGHEHGQGENRANDEPDVGVERGWEMFVGFVHSVGM
jgi:hypothetical protein